MHCHIGQHIIEHNSIGVVFAAKREALLAILGLKDLVGQVRAGL
jgi:hypothetical protein